MREEEEGSGGGPHLTLYTGYACWLILPPIVLISAPVTLSANYCKIVELGEWLLQIVIWCVTFNNNTLCYLVITITFTI